MSATFLEENEVTAESISDLFKSAFIKVSEIDEDKEFRIIFDDLGIVVSIDEENSRIRFFTFSSINDKSYEESILTINHITNATVMARFYIAISHEDTIFIVADYIMSYKMGVIPFQVVNMAKLFEQVAVNGFRTFFKNE